MGGTREGLNVGEGREGEGKRKRRETRGKLEKGERDT